MAFPYMAAASALGAGTSLIGSVYGANQSASAQRQTNEANERIAKENREFQERMSSTQFQRGVADAKAAGFNPLAAFPHPASTPMGATAMHQNPEPNRGELYSSAGRSFWDTMLTKELAKTEKSKQELNRAQASAVSGQATIPGLLRVPLDRAGAWWNSAKSRFNSGVDKLRKWKGGKNA